MLSDDHKNSNLEIDAQNGEYRQRAGKLEVLHQQWCNKLDIELDQQCRWAEPEKSVLNCDADQIVPGWCRLSVHSRSKYKHSPKGSIVHDPHRWRTNKKLVNGDHKAQEKQAPWVRVTENDKDKEQI